MTINLKECVFIRLYICMSIFDGMMNVTADKHRRFYEMTDFKMTRNDNSYYGNLTGRV